MKPQPRFSLNRRFVQPTEHHELIQQQRLLGAIRYTSTAATAKSDATESISEIESIPEIVAPLLPEGTADEVIEAWVVDKPVQYREAGDCRLGECGEYLFATLTIPDQNKAIDSLIYQRYLNLFDLLKEHGYPQLLRSWNYMPQINEADANGQERYRSFCAGRAQAFAEFYPENEIHMPAATGIGSHSGDIVIALLAARDNVGVVNIENPRQTPAYYYPRRYGPRSPSFARATAMVDAQGRQQLLISGTAAVVGSESRHIGDVRAQVEETLHNIAELITCENLYLYGVAQGFTLKDLRGVKVYIRHASDIAPVKAICERHFTDQADIVCLHADICREDLDVEIEGVIVPIAAGAERDSRTVQQEDNVLDYLLQQLLRRQSQSAYRLLDEQGKVVKSLSFVRLHHRVLTTAAALQQRHQHQTAVLLLLEDGIEFTVHYLACIFAGLIAVPVTAAKEEPLATLVNRLQHMIADLDRDTVLYSDDRRLAELQQQLPDMPCHSVQVAINQVEGFYQWQTIFPDQVTTILYTSGSVAEPKGVPLTHTQLITCALDNAAVCHYKEQSITVSWLSHAHMFGLAFNILLPLLTGSSCLLIKTADFIARPLLWLKALSRYRATHTAGAVFGYDLLLDHCSRHAEALEADWDLSLLEVALIAAENISETTFQRFQQQFSSLGVRPSVFSPSYGLSETGPITCKPYGAVAQFVSHPRGESAASVACVGKAVGDSIVVCVEPESLIPVADDQIGEVCIAGGSVIAGYWNQEVSNKRLFGQTIERYPEQSFFRTGDLGFLRDGQLYLVGRLKEMIIINGKNFYPVDIEGIARRTIPALQTMKAAAFSVFNDKGKEQLVLVQELPASQPEQSQLSVWGRDIVQALLQELQVPLSDLYWVEAGVIPRTASGKVQRGYCKQQLLDGTLEYPYNSLDLSNLQRRYEAPEGEIEIVLAEIWQELLGVERVGRHDQFFELGGHSLLAVQLIFRLRQQLAVEVPVNAVFKHASLTALAQVVVDNAQTTLSAITVADRSQPLPLSFGQAELWMRTQSKKLGSFLQELICFQFNGSLDKSVLEESVNTLIERHEILRTTFPELDGQPVQRIAPRLRITLPFVDLSALTDTEKADALADITQKESQALLDLINGPVWQIKLIRLSLETHHLLFYSHHILYDALSFGILTRELMAVYEATLMGKPSPLPPLPLQYADFAYWQRQSFNKAELENRFNYYQQLLSPKPPILKLPIDKPRSNGQLFPAAVESVEISRDLTQKLEGLCSQTGTTLFTVLLSAWTILLYCYSGAAEMIIGSPMSKRYYPGTETMFGYFGGRSMFKFDLSGVINFLELLHYTQKIVQEAMFKQDVTFGQLLHALNEGSEQFDLYSLPYQTILNFVPLSESENEITIDHLTLTPLQILSGQEKIVVDMVLNMTSQTSPAGSYLKGELRYRQDLFESTTVVEMLAKFKQLLDIAATNPKYWVTEFKGLLDI